ncbi:FmdB family zinc ribbon protein [Chloroflexota bacterium]
MPIYEYACRQCGSHFDLLQRFGDPRPASCPNGHSDVQRLLSQPAIIFKGSGFYVTDNKRNGRRRQGPDKSTREPKVESGAGTEKKEDRSDA